MFYLSMFHLYFFITFAITFTVDVNVTININFIIATPSGSLKSYDVVM